MKRRPKDTAQIDFLSPDYTTETATGHDVYEEASPADAPFRRLTPVEVHHYTGRAEDLAARVDRLDAKLDAIAHAIDTPKEEGTP